MDHVPQGAARSTTLEEVLERLTQVAEQLAVTAATPDLELKAFTPAEAAALLGKTENWVSEAIRDRRIPFTYIGRTPRLTAAHIRQIQQDGEVLPMRSPGRR
jgi:excisionase family DNA binding protein